jgi:uncharacterized membrane protein SpoIIM required for sporulation
LDELATLVKELESRPPTRDEARGFPKLYRQAVQDLADARARKQTGLGPAEAIVGRAHGILYAPITESARDWVRNLVTGFPRAVRRHLGAVGLAYALLGVGTLFGYAEIRRDPSNADVLLPPAMLTNADRFSDEHLSKSRGDPVNSASYFTNNSQVAFSAFAFGVTYGVGTVLALLFNGIVLGGTVAVVSLTRSPHALLSWLLPHAGVELTAIACAAGGGFVMARAMIAPGFRRRRDALADAAVAALPLALGASMLLIVAGATEASIAPMPWPIAVKGAIGLGLDLLLAAYLAMAGQARFPRG